MRRWNGWGDESLRFPVPPQAAAFLEAALGPGSTPRDLSLGEVVPAVPSTRLSRGVLLQTDSEVRLRHALGQSFPDWVALRSGRIPAFPDAVAFPESDADVRELLRFALWAGARVIPYGGGTSVVGHLTPPGGDAPVITADMGRMSRMTRLDETSGLATFGAGVAGPDLEAQLRARGFTLGHYPQSFDYSTLGGWVATRSSGQQSAYYGRIERLFAGGRLESPSGTLDLPAFPASAAGPDLREMVLGSEGRLGILTEATVRVRRLPAHEVFFGVFFPEWSLGLKAVRTMVQAGLPLSMVRLNTAEETRTSLLLAGKPRLTALLKRYLSLRHVREEGCLAILGVTGHPALCKIARAEALAAARAEGGVDVGETAGRAWRKNRFRAPYLRNSLWEAGFAVDTLETALSWSRIPTALDAVESALRGGLESQNEAVHVLSHLSHVYPDGASLYTTYLFRLSDPETSMERWRMLKGAASRAVAASGGTISHQHGVGTDHAPYLAAEKGPRGMATLSAVLKTLDPEGLMNPGKLIP
jgi:alkyldihydroxyacetonephosphate synthase